MGNIVLIGHDEEQEKQLIQALRDAVNSDIISVEKLDEQVYHVVKLKQNYALTNDSAYAPNIK